MSDASDLEEILSKSRPVASPEDDQAYLDRVLSNAPKQTYPFGAEKPQNTGFTRVGPGRINYTGTGTTAADVEPATTVLGRMAKTGAETIVPLATMEFGGGLVPEAMVKARPILGAMAKTGMRALFGAAGSEATAPLEGEAPSLSRGLKTARNIALTEGMVRAPAYLAGRAGGVEPAAAALAQDRPELMTKAPASEYAAAAKDISQTAENLPQTPEHFGYNMLLRAKGDVNGMPYVQRMLNQIRPGVDEPMSRLIEKKTSSLAEGLFNRLGPNGEISAEELDSWIGKNLREPAAKVWEGAAGTAWQQRLASMRDELAPALAKDVGGIAPELQSATHETLNKVEAAKKMFPEQTPNKPNIQSPTYLRQVLRDTDLGEQVRTRLKGLDEAAGSNHLQRVEDLAMRSSWTGAEKAEVEDILANVPAIGYERVGMVRAGARAGGRVLTRAARPAGRVAAVASTVRGTSQ